MEWYAEEKRQLGAYATFLGLSLKKPQGKKDGRWTALAVGDCCIFQVRDDRLVDAFPVNRSADFGNQPLLLGSRSLDKRFDPLSQAKRRAGRWMVGDRLFLMTDAVAQWFLRRQEEKRKPWQSLLRRLAEPNMANALTAYVDRLRRCGELKNDDITILAISF